MPPGTADDEERRAFVTRVIDGDTVVVEYAEGGAETIQLIGIKTPATTPENVTPEEYNGISDTPRARRHLSKWGQRAEQFTANKLSGASVRVVGDANATRSVTSDRRLAYVYFRDKNFNRLLVNKGYARVTNSSFSLQDEFETAESQASSDGTGLWKSQE